MRKHPLAHSSCIAQSARQFVYDRVLQGKQQFAEIGFQVAPAADPNETANKVTIDWGSASESGRGGEDADDESEVRALCSAHVPAHTLSDAANE